jgi:hypothetical protein
MSFLDFIGRILVWDPQERMRPLEALNHEWILEGLPRNVLIHHQQMLGLLPPDYQPSQQEEDEEEYYRQMAGEEESHHSRVLPNENSLERPSNTLVDESEEQFLEQHLLEDDYTDMVSLLQ